MQHMPPFVRRPVAAGVLVLIATSLPTGAPAQPAPPANACLPASVAASLLARETALLGSAHAQEHARARAQQCEAARGLRPIPAEGIVASPADTLRADRTVIAAAQALASGQSPVLSAQTRQAANTAAKQGLWSAPFVIPVTGVTSVVLNTGKVLFWSYDPNGWNDPNNSNTGVAMVWDPATRQGTSITPPENIWCGGQTILADGRVFVAGGNLRYPDPSVTNGTGGWEGTITTYTFDPIGQAWSPQPSMRHGRWYPSTTQLADNRVVITSGFDETGTQTLNSDVELFTPAPPGGMSTMSVVSQKTINLYPFQSVLASGQMLLAGTDGNSYQLDPATWNWSNVGAMRSTHYSYGNAITYVDASVSPATQLVMVAGGENATTTVTANEWLDGNNPLAGWRAYPQWLQPRHNVNTVILPDGTLFTVGGNAAMDNYSSPVLEAELYSAPAGNIGGSWRKVAANSIQAAYHSSAILLPDATVLLSQDDMDHSAAAAAQHKAQVYSPPYLFNGTQPTIVSAPAGVNYGQQFTISVTGRGVNSAVLVAPGAVTHGNDMHQRFIKLPVTVSGSTLTATVPASAALVPPGDYMLFILAKGIPSVAKFVRVS